MHTVVASPVRARAGAGAAVDRPRRRRRRHRLRRPGAAAPARPPSRGRADGGDVVGRRRASARPLPALGTPLGRRDRAARARRARRATPTSSSSRCPTRPPPSSRRRWSTRGVRVIDLSGAFRLRDAGARARWYPETHAHARRRRLRPDRAGARRHRAARGSSPTRAAIRRRRCSRWRRSPTPASSLPGADIIVDAKSGVSGAGKTPSERTHFSECHGSVSAYGVFNHRHGAEIEQGVGTARSPSCRTWCRSTAASSRRSTCASRPARPRTRVGDVLRARRTRGATFVRLVGIGAARDQARRAHELLRHRLARRSVGPRRCSCRSSTTC